STAIKAVVSERYVTHRERCSAASMACSVACSNRSLNSAVSNPSSGIRVRSFQVKLTRRLRGWLQAGSYLPNRRDEIEDGDEACRTREQTLGRAGRTQPPPTVGAVYDRPITSNASFLNENQ